MKPIKAAILCGIASLGLTACIAPTATEGVTRAGTGVAPLLATSYGPVRGSREDGVAVFKGVRYAASTEGYRFQPARPPRPWSTPVDARDYGNDCPQADGGDVPLFASWVNDRPRSEDCLVLNVWTRGIGDGGKRPIMVWLHGGGYLAGSGSSHGYDGVRLANRGDVVVVTINHRLNGFGHLYAAGLSNDPGATVDPGDNIFSIERSVVTRAPILRDYRIAIPLRQARSAPHRDSAGSPSDVRH